MNNLTHLTKKCSLCSDTKTLNEFALAKGRKDGRQSYCRPCFGEYIKVKKQLSEEQKGREVASLIRTMRDMMDDHILAADVKQKLVNMPSLGRVTLSELFA